jgi:oxygen-independent coproporphyrinogen-3 oxidase
MIDLSSPQAVSSLYVHVPFCAQKCAYCAFYSEASEGQIIRRYLAALLREIEIMAGDLHPQTIFFGGGTPSLLNLLQWKQIFEGIERSNLQGADEWTVECNPATVSLDKAKLLRDNGVNRISMGVQSLNEELLVRLGRIHNRQMVFKSFDILRKAGFENINLDLMFAIPGQTMDIWHETLCEALSLGSEHLSCYEVIYEEDTALYAQLKAGEFAVNEELACAMYDELIQRADRQGFVQGGAFYGFGPSASSFVGGIRSKNWSNTLRYCQELEQGRHAIEWREELPPLGRAGETAAFGLRMNAGWKFGQFKRTTGFDLRQEWSREMEQLANQGWGKIETDRFYLTPNGLRFADAAALMFLRP